MTRSETFFVVAATSMLFLPQLAGCDRAQEGAARTIADSAGIQIVTLRMQHPDSDWLVDSTTALEIGVAAGREALELSQVIGAVTLTDGRIVVANGGTSELRFYERAGKHLRSVGGDGEGPGEFRDLRFIGISGGDTILTYDTRLRRISLFDGDGAFLGSRPVTGVILPYVAGVLGSGTIAAWEFTGADDDRVGIYTAPVVFGMAAAGDGVFHPIDTIPSGEAARVHYQGRLTRAFRPFGRESDIAAGGAFIFVLASSDDRSIRVYDASGVLKRIVRVDAAVQAINAAAVDAWTDSWVRRYANGSPQLEAAWRHGFRETPPPEHVPWFRSLEVDMEGNVCAERYPLTVDAGPVYWCFTPDGRFLGALQLSAALVRRGPPHFDPQLEIAPGHVLGVYADSLDVQSVRRIAVRRSSARRDE